jgi:hypothetical protein
MRARWVNATEPSTAAAASAMLQVTRSPRKSADHDIVSTGLRQMQLADLGDAALG